MKLQTNIPLREQEHQINYRSKLVLLGSCFSQNIGEQLEYFKFQRLQNPFGIVFNPVSTEILLKRVAANNRFKETDLFEKDGLWHCLEVHSLVNAQSKPAYLDLLNSSLDELRNYMAASSHVILTFGTAWIYRYLATNEVVANCHKIPQKEFNKELLSVELISEAIEKIITHIRSVNKNAQIITTISPVRHLKDGFVENARSKAHLLSGLHKVLDEKEGLYYFPSYEVMMDELRDYRFYQSDLLHPNETAISIIWEKFKSVWISSETEPLQKEIDTIQKGLQHRPFNAKGTVHRKFQKNLQEKIEKVRTILPHIDFLTF